MRMLPNFGSNRFSVREREKAGPRQRKGKRRLSGRWLDGIQEDWSQVRGDGYDGHELA
jgi:hypothetical protein